MFRKWFKYGLGVSALSERVGQNLRKLSYIYIYSYHHRKAYKNIKLFQYPLKENDKKFGVSKKCITFAIIK